MHFGSFWNKQKFWQRCQNFELCVGEEEVGETSEFLGSFDSPSFRRLRNTFVPFGHRLGGFLH